MPRRHIHTQGDFDGACFLYSIANAYTALTKRFPRLSEWDRGIREIPHALDFLQGNVGTTSHYREEPELMEKTLGLMLGQFAANEPPLRAECFPEMADLVDIGSLIDRDSVVLFWYEGETEHVPAGDHWVCAVAVDWEPFRLHLACSIRYSEDGLVEEKDYEELEHADVDRFSNDSVTVEHRNEVVRGSVFRICRP